MPPRWALAYNHNYWIKTQIHTWIHSEMEEKMQEKMKGKAAVLQKFDTHKRGWDPLFILQEKLEKVIKKSTENEIFDDVERVLDVVERRSTSSRDGSTSSNAPVFEASCSSSSTTYRKVAFTPLLWSILQCSSTPLHGHRRSSSIPISVLHKHAN
jgi:hypothetical protein